MRFVGLEASVRQLVQETSRVWGFGTILSNRLDDHGDLSPPRRQPAHNPEGFDTLKSS